MTGNSEKIKVLAIVNASFGYDGISNVATNYYLYQDKNAVEMDLLTINPINEALESEIKKNNNKVFVLPFRNSNPLKYVIALKKIIKENKYDIVYVHGNSATMAVELISAKLAGCKVRVAHSHNTQCNHMKINKLLMPFFSLLYTDCCACSPEAGKFLFGNRECYVVNNGIYVPKYEFSEEIRDKIRTQLGVENKFVIGHIGRFAYQKNQEFLINILKVVIEKGEDAVLLLVGEGETIEMVKSTAESLGVADRVIFFGTTDFVNEVVQAMDCFVFPSRFEGLGIVAIEAQASGLSCVASTEVPEKVKINDKTTFLSLESDVTVWASAVIERKTTASTRAALVSETKKNLEKAKFDIEKNCADMLDYYKKICEERK
ncbi:MAG: glycosyltransferase family 1 protein [Clostridia bacterium]|nr:glycosyltransferase family 1 protein [Clostridia bacterium]